jgi:hypothetical protein
MELKAPSALEVKGASVCSVGEYDANNVAWAAPAVMFSSAGYYLMAVADLVDGAVALTAPAAMQRRGAVLSLR